MVSVPYGNEVGEPQLIVPPLPTVTTFCSVGDETFKLCTLMTEFVPVDVSPKYAPLPVTVARFGTSTRPPLVADSEKVQYVAARLIEVRFVRRMIEPLPSALKMFSLEALGLEV